MDRRWMAHPQSRRRWRLGVIRDGVLLFAAIFVILAAAVTGFQG